MLKLLKKNGKAQFVVLTLADYEAFHGMIEDSHDVLMIQEARKRNGNAAGILLDEMKRRLCFKAPRKANAG